MEARTLIHYTTEPAHVVRRRLHLVQLDQGVTELVESPEYAQWRAQVGHAADRLAKTGIVLIALYLTYTVAMAFTSPAFHAVVSR